MHTSDLAKDNLDKLKRLDIVWHNKLKAKKRERVDAHLTKQDVVGNGDGS